MLKQIWNVATVSFRRWITDGKTVFGLFLLLLFCYLTFAPLYDIVALLKVKVSPWVYNFLFSYSPLLLVTAGITILIFSDTFVMDTYSQLLMVRSGRRAYIWGQILFVCLAAFMVVITSFLFCLLVICPSVGWSADWGKAIYTIAEQVQLIIERTGVELYFLIDSTYINTVAAIPSTLLSLLLLWLYLTYTAFLIGSLRILTGKMFGVAISGFFVFVSLFAINAGALAFGNLLRFMSPLLWCTPVNLNWYGITGLPTFGYAVTIYGLSIMLMVIASVVRFQQGDIRETIGG